MGMHSAPKDSKKKKTRPEAAAAPGGKKKAAAKFEFEKTRRMELDEF